MRTENCKHGMMPGCVYCERDALRAEVAALREDKEDLREDKEDLEIALYRSNQLRYDMERDLSEARAQVRSLAVLIDRMERLGWSSEVRTEAANEARAILRRDESRQPITKEWCETMAKQEGDSPIAAGLLGRDEGGER